MKPLIYTSLGNRISKSTESENPLSFLPLSPLDIFFAFLSQGILRTLWPQSQFLLFFHFLQMLNLTTIQIHPFLTEAEETKVQPCAGLKETLL